MESWIAELSFEDAICFSFDILPSRVNALIWELCYHDIRFKIRMKLQYEVVRSMQDLDNLYRFGAALFGSGDSSTKTGSEESVEVTNVMGLRDMAQALGGRYVG